MNKNDKPKDKLLEREKSYRNHNSAFDFEVGEMEEDYGNWGNRIGQQNISHEKSLGHVHLQTNAPNRKKNK